MKLINSDKGVSTKMNLSDLYLNIVKDMDAIGLCKSNQCKMFNYETIHEDSMDFDLNHKYVDCMNIGFVRKVRFIEKKYWSSFESRCKSGHRDIMIEINNTNKHPCILNIIRKDSYLEINFGYSKLYPTLLIDLFVVSRICKENNITKLKITFDAISVGYTAMLLELANGEKFTGSLRRTISKFNIKQKHRSWSSLDKVCLKYEELTGINPNEKSL